MASRAIATAWSNVLPHVTQPGNAGTVTEKPPSPNGASSIVYVRSSMVASYHDAGILVKLQETAPPVTLRSELQKGDPCESLELITEAVLLSPLSLDPSAVVYPLASPNGLAGAGTIAQRVSVRIALPLHRHRRGSKPVLVF